MFHVYLFMHHEQNQILKFVLSDHNENCSAIYSKKKKKEKRKSPSQCDCALLHGQCDYVCLKEGWRKRGKVLEKF